MVVGVVTAYECIKFIVRCILQRNIRLVIMNHQSNFKELESLTDCLLNIACVYRLRIGAGSVGWEELVHEKLITGLQAPPIPYSMFGGMARF